MNDLNFRAKNLFYYITYYVLLLNQAEQSGAVPGWRLSRHPQSNFEFLRLKWATFLSVSWSIQACAADLNDLNFRAKSLFYYITYYVLLLSQAEQSGAVPGAYSGIRKATLNFQA